MSDAQLDELRAQLAKTDSAIVSIEAQGERHCCSGCTDRFTSGCRCPVSTHVRLRVCVRVTVRQEVASMLAMVPAAQRRTVSDEAVQVCHKWALDKLDVVAGRVKTLALAGALHRWCAFAQHHAAWQHAKLYSRSQACARLAGVIQRWSSAAKQHAFDAWWMRSEFLRKQLRCVVARPIQSALLESNCYLACI